MLPSADALARLERPLDWTPAKRRLLVDACREMASFHAGRCPAVGRLYAKRGFDPATVREEDDLARIPALPASAFKSLSLLSLPPERASAEISSSGTQGPPSRVRLDAGSLERLSSLYRGLWEQLGLLGGEPVNHAVFASPPEEAPGVALARSFDLWRGLAPERESFHAVRRQGGEPALDGEGAYRRLADWSRRGGPVRLIGTPPFLWEFLELVESRGRLTLPAGSSILTSGGWKGRRRAVGREDFIAAARDRLGVAGENARDVYGGAELRVIFPECARHRFHVPASCHMLALDPETMRPLPAGRPGLLEFVAPFNAMMPTLALLPGDLGLLHEDRCACGLASPTFAVLGRVEGDPEQGCALKLEAAAS